MESEKSPERLQAEKKAMDAAGHSELLADLQADRQQGDDTQGQQQGKKIFSASKKPQVSGVILERKSE